jgi:hypothetical protein
MSRQGFNEPERGDQANLSVGQAIDLWRRHMEPLKSKYPGIQLGAPGVSAAPEGPAWLRGFMDGCTGCSIDFIPIHWYGDGAQWFLEYVEKMRRDFGKKLWVTEYASTNGDDGGKCSPWQSPCPLCVVVQTLISEYGYSCHAIHD